VPRARQLDPAILEAALSGLEAQQQRLEEQIESVRRMLGGRRRATVAAPGAINSSATAPALGGRTKRVMSAAARKLIAAAQRKRWADLRQAKAGKEKPAAKRRLSPEGRKRIVEAARRRWAEVRKAKAAASTKKAPAKRTAKAGTKAPTKYSPKRMRVAAPEIQPPAPE
jgi:hypothetical protein